MRKHTLIANEYDEARHACRIILGTDIGTFTGEVVCRPEDQEYESKYFGWELAEMKAMILHAKAKARYYDALWAELVSFWKDMSTTRTFDENAFWVKKIAQRVDMYDDKAREWKEVARSLKEAYHVKVMTFDAMKSTRNRCKEYNQ